MKGTQNFGIAASDAEKNQEGEKQVFLKGDECHQSRLVGARLSQCQPGKGLLEAKREGRPSLLSVTWRVAWGRCSQTELDLNSD